MLKKTIGVYAIYLQTSISFYLKVALGNQLKMHKAYTIKKNSLHIFIEATF